MKFIFPQNYNFKNKIFGVLDYTTAIINILWCSLVFILINIFLTSLNIKIFLFIILCFPLLLLSLSGFNGENILYVFSYMFKFINKQKIYFYNKNSISKINKKLLNFLSKKDII